MFSELTLEDPNSKLNSVSSINASFISCVLCFYRQTDILTRSVNWVVSRDQQNLCYPALWKRDVADNDNTISKHTSNSSNTTWLHNYESLTYVRNIIIYFYLFKQQSDNHDFIKYYIEIKINSLFPLLSLSKVSVLFKQVPSDVL